MNNREIASEIEDDEGVVWCYDADGALAEKRDSDGEWTIHYDAEGDPCGAELNGYVARKGELANMIEHIEDYGKAEYDPGLDVHVAAIKLDLSPEEMENNYRGEFASAADFAEDFAESTGAATDDWPYNCIDWDSAAQQLMGDFHEQDGHYFWAH